MLEPIDININMNQNVSEEAAKAAVANEEMTSSVDTLQKEIERLNKVVQDMSTALAEQKKQASGYAGELDNTTRKIDVMQAALDKAKQELAIYQATCEQMTKAVREGADVTDILSDAEKGLAETKGALVDNAKELISNQEDINEKLTEGGKSANTYSTSNQILSTAIKEVCDSLGIENTQVKNTIGNVKVIQAVKDGWRQTLVLLNKEIGLTTAQSKALMFTVIGTLIVGITTLVFIYKKWRDEQEKINKLQQEYRKFQSEATAATQAQVSKVQILEKVLRDSNNTYTQRNKALDELKSIMPEYNALLDKEGRLIEDNTGALKKYVQQLKNAALAKGAMDKLVTAENALTEQTSILTPEQRALFDVSDIDIQSNKYTDRQRNEWLYLKAYFLDYIQSVELWTKEVEKYTKENIDEVVENTKGYWEKKQQQAFEALARLTPEDRKNKTTAWSEAYSAYLNASEMLKTWDLKGQLRDNKKSETAAAKEAREQEKAANSLEKKAYEYQKRIDAATVKAIHEGAEKERQAAKTEYDQTRAFLEREYKSIDGLEKKTGKPATEERTLLIALDVEATRQYEAEISRINSRSKTTIDNIFTEVNARFASELEQNISGITQYYAELIKEATKAGATIEEISSLQIAKEKDAELARINSRLSQLDFEQEIATRQLESANKVYAFEADKEKELLNLQLSFAEKRRDVLQEAYNINPNDELAKSLQAANVEVNNLKNNIGKLPAKKFTEILGIVNQIADSVGSLANVDLSMLTNTLNGLIKYASGDMLGAASSGLGVVTNLLSGILGSGERENQIKRELIRLQQEYNISLRQQNFELIDSIDYLHIFRNNIEALNWLIEKGFISNLDYSVWESLNKGFEEAMANLEAASKEYDKKLQSGAAFFYEIDNSAFHEKYQGIIDDWKKGIIDTEEAFRRFGAKGWKGMTEIADSIAKAEEETEKWKDELIELSQQMDEFATGTSFDGFLNDATNAVKEMYGDITNLANFTEEALTNAILSSFKYQVLSNALKPFYDELSDKFISDFDNLDKAWANDWKDRLQAELGDKAGVLEDLFASLGIDNSQNERQGATGGFASASQDSVNELTGGVYAVRQIIGDIRNDNREELLIQRTITGQLSVLVERSEYWQHLQQLPRVAQLLNDIETYGLKMKE